jgi:hypothetical protein
VRIAATVCTTSHWQGPFLSADITSAPPPQFYFRTFAHPSVAAYDMPASRLAEFSFFLTFRLALVRK